MRHFALFMPGRPCASTSLWILGVSATCIGTGACVQIKQGFTARHGYETPDAGDAAGLAEAGVMGEYQSAIEAAHAASRRISAVGA